MNTASASAPAKASAASAAPEAAWPNAWPQASALWRVATARAVHAHEAAHPQDDVAAVDRAGALSRDPQTRVQVRAWLLGEGLGLHTVWPTLVQRAVWIWLAVVLLIVLVAWGMSVAVMGGDSRINLLGALLSLLGTNLLMLVLWLLSFWPSKQGGTSKAPLALGGWVQSGLQLVARRMGEPTQRLLAGAFAVLTHVRGLPWLNGLISHSAWALGFALILLLMAWGFAFRAYQPVLETTILSASTVNTMLDVLGWLPQAVGIARPSLEAASGGQWAWWLMACVLGYGLLPRALLGLLCALVLRHRLQRVALPEDDAGYQWALARFKRLDVSRVLDADQSLAPPKLAQPRRAPAPWALLLHELPQLTADDAALWRQLQALAERSGQLQGAPVWAGSCDGSAKSLNASVAAVSQLPASADGKPWLVLCVSGVASPDRSVARFMRKLLTEAGGLKLALWWDAASTPESARAEWRARWHDWLLAEQLPIDLLEEDLA